MAKLPRKGRSRTKEIVPGINTLSHAQVVKKSARYKWFNKGGPKKAAEAPAAGKAPRFYPADDIPKPKAHKSTKKATKLKKGVVPGSVLILLSGRFRGKRVIFLKQLASGTLLVTGPYNVNGVPIRRVNQSYTIVTSTVVDISGVKIPDHIDDAYFAREESEEKKDEDQYFTTEKKETVVSDKRKADQAALDKALAPAIAKVEALGAYLKAKFSLKQGDKPHEMKF